MVVLMLRGAKVIIGPLKEVEFINSSSQEMVDNLLPLADSVDIRSVANVFRLRSSWFGEACSSETPNRI